MDWKLTEIQISKINPTVKNPKTRDKAGFETLRKSLEKFGRVFDGIVNAVNKDGTYDLIVGNSRLEQIKGQKTGMYFVPDKRLTEKEYREFNSIFDVAKAGELDFEMVFEDLGQEFMDDWELDFEGGKEKKDLSDNIDLKHIIEVELNSEEDQELLFYELQEKGYKCKILA